MEFTILLLLILACESQSDLQHVLPTAESAHRSTTKTVRKKCNYDTVYGMTGVDCSGMELQNIPTNLKSSIQVFDASYNRIRKILKSDLARYPYIKFLYLGDNMIMYIEPGSLEQLTYLEVLDLSLNSFQIIPAVIFEISTLRKLYIANNTIIVENWDKISIPIKAQLGYIDLSHSNLRSVPRLGPLPFLTYLNLSGNRFDKVTTEDLMPFCRLKTLDISFTGRYNMNTCECIKLYDFITKHKIDVKTGGEKICNYDILVSVQCINHTNQFKENQIHQQCAEIIYTTEQQTYYSRRTWLTVIFCMIGFLVLFIVILYLVHRYNAASMKLKERKNTTESKLLSS